MHLWTLALLSRLLLGSGVIIHCLGGFPYISNQVVLHRFLRWYSNPFLAGVIFQILGLSVTTCICTFNVSAFLQICIIRKITSKLSFRVSSSKFPKSLGRWKDCFLVPWTLNRKHNQELQIIYTLKILPQQEYLVGPQHARVETPFKGFFCFTPSTPLSCCYWLPPGINKINNIDDTELQKCVEVKVIKPLIPTPPDVVWSGSMSNSWKFC